MQRNIFSFFNKTPKKPEQTLSTGVASATIKLGPSDSNQSSQGSSRSSSRSPEQIARAEANRKRALEIRAAKGDSVDLSAPSPFAGLLSSSEHTPELPKRNGQAVDTEKTFSPFARKTTSIDDSSTSGSVLKRPKLESRRGLVLDSEDDEMVLQLDDEDDEKEEEDHGVKPMDLEEEEEALVKVDDGEAKFASFSFGVERSQGPSQQNREARKKLVSAEFETDIPVEEAMVEEFPFLRDIKDAKGNKPGDDNYDPSTLHIPDAQFNKLSKPRQQFWEIKRNNFDKVIFFQVGAFYELFAMDADLGLKLLGLKIHSKGSAGFPCNQWEKFALDFLRRGYKVLRVDQGEDDGKVKKRNIGEALTIGTVIEPGHLPGVGSNYIMSVACSTDERQSGKNFSVTFSDLSLLESYVSFFCDDRELSQLCTMIEIIRPRELVYCSSSFTQKQLRTLKMIDNSLVFSSVSVNFWWDTVIARSNIKDLYKKVGVEIPKTLEECENELVYESFGALMNYLQSLKVGGKAKLLIESKVLPYRVGSSVAHSGITKWGSMILDSVTLRNLDLFHNTVTGKSEGSLWEILNGTQSAMGQRLLHKWISHPLMDISTIKERQEALNCIVSGKLEKSVCFELQSLLKSVGDIDRMICRIHAVYSNENEQIKMSPIKLAAFVDLIDKLRTIEKTMKSVSSNINQCASSNMLQNYLRLGSKEFPDFANELHTCTRWWRTETSAEEGLAFVVKEGDGDEELENARADKEMLEKAVKTFLTDAQKNVHKKAAFKVNSDDTYIIRVPASTPSSDIPGDWILDKKGSTKTMNGFKSRELDDLVAKMNESVFQYDQMRAFQQTKALRQFDQHYQLWRRITYALSTIDCLLALAHACQSFGEYVFPTFVEDEQVCRLMEVRHPMVEKTVQAMGSSYVPSNIVLKSPLSLITGPNSGGKSTVLRTVAISCILAQIGCAVPAKEATLSLVDRIFTRIGAQDSIMNGKSTFMLEMDETSSILRDATKNSLLIVDELGRGTSTNDGYAIAWAVVHYLSSLGALTLFATHYHGLATDFANTSGVTLNHLAFMKEEGARDVVFLYQFKEGASGESYGLNVAQIAGIPENVLDAAESVSKKSKTSGMFSTDTSIAVFEEVMNCKDKQVCKKILLESGY